MSFTNLPPVLPSEIPCNFQGYRSVVLREEPSDLLLSECGMEHQIAFEPDANIETSSCAIKLKQGNEIDVHNATIQRYAILPIPHDKFMCFEHTKRHYHLNEHSYNMFISRVSSFTSSSYVLLHKFIMSLCYAFIHIFASRNEFEHKKFFRHGGFLFDKDETCEPNRNFMDIDRLSKVTHCISSHDTTEVLSVSRPYTKGFDILVYNKLLVKSKGYSFDSCYVLSRVFDENIQVKHNEELNFHAPKTWLFHVWLKKIVVQLVLEPWEYLRKEQHIHERQGRVIFDPGGKMRIQIKREHTPVNIRINAYKISLQGEYILIYFNGSNLICFLADCSDLRTNPFQVGEDDVIMGSKQTIGFDLNQEEHGAKEYEHEPDLGKHDPVLGRLDLGKHDPVLGRLDLGKHDPDLGRLEEEESLLVPDGPMTRARAKRLKDSVSGLLQQVDNHSLHEGKELITSTLVVIKVRD